MKNLFSTGDVSKMFDVSVDTLRYYDKIGIVSPKVNEENKYREYDLKDLYLLSFILGARYLEVSIKDIKECLNMESLDLDKYIEFMEKQKKLVGEKIRYLKKIEKTIKNSIDVIKDSRDNGNMYEVEKIEVSDKRFSFYAMPIQALISKNICKRFSKSIEIEGKTIEYFSKIEVNKEVDNLYLKGEYVYVEKSEETAKIINKIKREGLDILEYDFNKESINVKFLGDEEEIYRYINEIRKYFNIEDGDIFIKIYTFFKSKNEEKSFVQIVCKV